MYKIATNIFYLKIKILTITEIMMNKGFQPTRNFYFKKIKKYKMSFPEF